MAVPRRRYSSSRIFSRSAAIERRHRHRPAGRRQAVHLHTARAVPCDSISTLHPLNACVSVSYRGAPLMLPKHGRYDYSPISERPDYSWPDGKRLAFSVVTNIEVYAYRKGTGWDPAKSENLRTNAIMPRATTEIRRHMAPFRAVRSARATRRAQCQFPPVRLSSADLRTHSQTGGRNHRPWSYERGAPGQSLGAGRKTTD